MPEASVDIPDLSPLAKAGSYALAAGTNVEVETLEMIDSEASPSGAFVRVRVSEDVKGPDGKTAIPARSSGIVVVLSATKVGGESKVSLSLYQLTVDEKTYLLVHGRTQLATLELAASLTKGAGHGSVHLERGSRLIFKVTEAFDLKR